MYRIDSGVTLGIESAFLLSKVKVQVHGRSIAQWALLAMCFSAGLSKSLFAISAFFLLVGWGISGSWRDLKRSKCAMSWVLLTIWIYGSSIWSEGTPSTVSHSMGVQWKLLLIPVIATLLDRQEWADKCWRAFAAGMAVLLLHIYALSFIAIPWTASQDPRGVFFNPLPQSVGLAIFTVWCFYQLLVKKVSAPTRGALILLMFGGAYAVLGISLQRLGYLSLLVGGGLVLVLCLPPKKRLLGLTGLALATFLVVALSPKIQSRIEQAHQDIQSYNFENNYSSLGARFHMWVVSVKAIREDPIIGHGIGSYPVVSERAFDDAKMCEQGCDHPHNQYLYYALEFGLVGLGIFLFAVASAVRLHRDSHLDSVMPVAVLLIFLMVGLADTTLWYRGYLHLFIPLIGMTSAALRDEK